MLSENLKYGEKKVGKRKKKNFDNLFYVRMLMLENSFKAEKNNVYKVT